MKILLLCCACSIIACGVPAEAEANGNGEPVHVKLKVPYHRKTRRGRPATPSPEIFAYVGKRGDVHLRILPVQALDLAHEKAILESKAQKGVRFVAMQIINRGEDPLIWRDVHDAVKITLKNGIEMTSGEAGPLLGDENYPWGFTHIADLVAQNFTIPPSGTCVKFLALRGEFTYEDIASAEIQLGHLIVPMKKIKLKRSKSSGLLPRQIWKHVPVSGPRKK